MIGKPHPDSIAAGLTELASARDDFEAACKELGRAKKRFEAAAAEMDEHLAALKRAADAARGMNRSVYRHE
jgi:exonuclease VII small subunit